MGFTLITLLSMNSFSQKTNTENTKFENTTAQINKSSIPTSIISFHDKEFPITTSEKWYGYPEFPIDINWFHFNTQNNALSVPQYYIVEFTKDTIRHRLIYDTVGKKINTYKSINPKIQTKIAKSLISSKYQDWRIINEKEELFRDLDLDILIIYKVELQKRNEKRFLFYSEDGLLIRDKEVDL